VYYKILVPEFLLGRQSCIHCQLICR